MKRLRGALTALATPFGRTGELELDALPGLIEWQRAAGVDGVVICGTNGEGPSLSVEERKRLLERAVALAGDMLVIAGTGAASVVDAVELTRHAGDAGADAVLVLPPFYFKNPSARGVADYYERVLGSATIPVLLYSIPQVSAVAVTDDILNLLQGRSRLAGMKDSAGAWERTSALIEAHPEMAIFAGADELMSLALAAGGAGVISGTSNAFPDLLMAVKRAFDAGEDTAEPQARLVAAKRVLQTFPPLCANKPAMALRGLPRTYMRPPLVDLTADEELLLEARLHEAGLL